MSRTIYKFELKDELCTIELPKGAKVILAGEKEGQTLVWFEVNRTNENERRVFKVFGTGWPIPMFFKHVYSWISVDRYHVWHLYELRESMKGAL